MGDEGIDFSLLVDGLTAEREQGITIDVAYRFFSTEKRKFIVADTPGHEQYTRNMVTGASAADLAVILIDARKGVLTQTRRHSYLVHLLGIRHVVLAVNKMDLVGYDQGVFDQIVADYRTFADSIGIEAFVPIPISGYMGDNITAPSENTPWYDGVSLLPHLEEVDIESTKEPQAAPFRMPVQWVNRPNLDFRGFSGLIASGVIQPGDPVRVLPSGKTSKVARVVTYDGDRAMAVAGEAVTLTLEDEIDCSRGQVIVAAQSPLEVADQFESTLIWMDEQEMVPGRAYWLKIGTQTVSATVQHPKLRGERQHPGTPGLEDAGPERHRRGEYHHRPRDPLRPLRRKPRPGRLHPGGQVHQPDRRAGMLNFALRRAQNIHWQATDIGRDHHASMKHQKPTVLWLTGLSGSGKSTIANIVEKKLARMNRHTFLLDGDNVRHGLNKDLGFTETDRVENIRRVGEVAKLMTDAGLIVITAFISPFRSERDMVRGMMQPGEFVEVFVDTPLEVAEARDVKGLYAKARSGQLKNFTGIDSPYEAPDAPEIRVDTTEMTPDQAADAIIARLIP